MNSTSAYGIVLAMKRNYLLGLIFLIVLLPFVGGTQSAQEQQPEARRVPATVVRVVDGDTAVFLIDGIEAKVRFIGVDTPETKHPNKPVEELGQAASDFTTSLLPVDLEVTLEYDVQEKDRYQRHLCYVWLDNETMLNERLVAEGYATVATYPPNVKYVDVFTRAQQAARENELGLWAS